MPRELPQNSYKNVPASTTTTVKSGPGILVRLIINQFAISTGVTLYDNTAASGTKIASPVLGSTLFHYGTLEFDCLFTTGLTVVCAAGWDVTVVYQ